MDRLLYLVAASLCALALGACEGPAGPPAGTDSGTATVVDAGSPGPPDAGAPPSTLKEAAAAGGVIIGVAQYSPAWPIPQHASDIIATEFDLMMPGDGLLVVIWTGPGQYDWRGIDAAVAWAQARGLRLRSGQAFYAPACVLVPSWLHNGDCSARADGVSAAALSEHMRAFVEALVGRYGTTFLYYEVANELVMDGGKDFFYQHSDIGLAGGRSVAQYVAQLATWAKAANPAIKTSLNEGRNEDGGAPYIVDAVCPHFGGGFLALLDAIRAAPGGENLDAAGVQGHLHGPKPGDPAHPYQCRYLWDEEGGVRWMFGQLAARGFDVHVTELGVTAPLDAQGLVSAADQAVQAETYARFVRAAREGAGSRLVSIMLWGVTDAYPQNPAFDPGGLPWDVEGRKKAAWAALRDALASP